MRGPLAGWRLPLRLAWRDARRAKGRSLLVLVMIALPVMGVAAADTLYSTQSVSGVEGLERRLGTAEARVSLAPGSREAVQDADPDTGVSAVGPRREPGRATLADVERVLGVSDLPAVELETESTRAATDGGQTYVELTGTDLLDPLTRGLVEPVSGRLPRTDGEAVVNADLAERGPGVGEELELAGGTRLEVVGIVESAQGRGFPMAWARPAAVDGQGAGSTLLIGGAAVTWEQVRALNALGATVLSRAVVTDPPPESALPPEIRGFDEGIDEATVTVLALVVVMVLIEVVLLAGPAFAVGARRQSRTLALIAAAGGVPGQARRVVLATGVVLGSLGAVLGLALGLLAAVALTPVLQGFSTTRFGPFDVTWLHLAGIAAFGTLSALLAAAVPAWIASRQDVVAVLAGRRGDTRASRRSPLLGLVLLGVGVAGAAYGASGGGEIAIAASAIVSVLAMILLVPVVVLAVSRLAGRLPLPLRFAARDAARHRTRTVPAVAAVAATVAGVVALGIAVSSDEHQNQETYQPTLADGYGLVTAYGGGVDWPAYRDAVARTVPEDDVSTVQALVLPVEGRGFRQLEVAQPGDTDPLLVSVGGPFASATLVADRLPPGLPGIDATEADRASRVLASGGVVAFASEAVDGDRVVLRTAEYSGRGRVVDRQRLEVAGTYVQVDGDYSPVDAVVAPAVADRLGGRTRVTGLVVDAPITEAAERSVDEALTALPGQVSLSVERGYVADEETVIVQLILAALGAVLMLGGTLTATFLALSDARPDLATLSAVGASPRSRRAIAAAYALVVGLVGAVLGALVGAIPGVAITYPLTGPGSSGTTGGPATYLDVPWLLVTGVVLGLPLLTAAVVGLTARSRLPLVARLD